jgi:taurine dioxygenase
LGSSADCPTTARPNSRHSDVTLVDRVPPISILRAIELPPCGGSAVWANTARAYADLSEALKALADRLWAVHANLYDYAGHVDSTRIGGVDVKEQACRDEFRSRRYETEHPLVRVHPETGERVLLLGHSVKRIVGVTAPSRRRSSSCCRNRVTRLENTVRRQWTDGDVAIWDNRATQHYGVADYDNARRRLHRITIAGDVPVSVDGVTSTTIDGDAAHFSAL